jgi:hypothetical protein
MNQDISQTSTIATLLRELRDEASTLLRQQVTLAKVEMKENMTRLAGHAAKIAVGGLVAFAGAIVLFIGLGHLVELLLIKAGLEQPNAQWLGLVIVGLLVAVTGAVLLSKAKNAIAHEQIAPRQTIETLQTDKQWAQEKTATLS